MTSDKSLTLQTKSTPDNPAAETSEEVISAPPPYVETKFDRTRYTQEQRDERRQTVWRMSVVDRKSWRQIAKELNISGYTINQDIRWVEANRVKTLAEADKVFVVEQDQIYNALLDKWLPIALRENDDSEECFTATDKVTTVLANQAKLHGFGAAGKVSAKEAGKEMGQFVLEAMRQLAHGGKIIEGEIINDNTKPLLDNRNTDGVPAHAQEGS